MERASDSLPGKLCHWEPINITASIRFDDRATPSETTRSHSTTTQIFTRQLRTGSSQKNDMTTLYNSLTPSGRYHKIQQIIFWFYRNKKQARNTLPLSYLANGLFTPAIIEITRISCHPNVSRTGYSICPIWINKKQVIASNGTMEPSQKEQLPPLDGRCLCRLT